MNCLMSSRSCNNVERKMGLKIVCVSFGQNGNALTISHWDHDHGVLSKHSLH